MPSSTLSIFDLIATTVDFEAKRSALNIFRSREIFVDYINARVHDKIFCTSGIEYKCDLNGLIQSSKLENCNYAKLYECKFYFI